MGPQGGTYCVATGPARRWRLCRHLDFVPAFGTPKVVGVMQPSPHVGTDHVPILMLNARWELNRGLGSCTWFFYCVHDHRDGKALPCHALRSLFTSSLLWFHCCLGDHQRRQGLFRHFGTSPTPRPPRWYGPSRHILYIPVLATPKSGGLATLIFSLLRGPPRWYRICSRAAHNHASGRQRLCCPFAHLWHPGMARVMSPIGKMCLLWGLPSLHGFRADLRTTGTLPRKPRRYVLCPYFALIWPPRAVGVV